MTSGAPPDPSLAELQAKVARFRDERDWAQFHTLKDLAAAIAIEAGELQEEFLWLSHAGETERLTERRDEVSQELADILILALGFADAAGIDASQAILDKLDANAERYPVEKARGRAAKYTDL